MLQVDQNYEIDPIFGLPVTKESCKVEAARNKNSSYEKRLSDEMSSLDLELKSRRVRLLSDEASVKDFLGEILTTEGGKVASPSTLIGKQRHGKRSLRTGPSRSLSEFDEKLKQIKKARETERYKTSTFPSLHGLHLAEYRIKRNLYRTKSEHNLLKECEKHSTVYNIINDQKTIYPLYRRKTVAMDAYQRSLSYIEPPLSPKGRRKSVKNTDIFVTSKQFTQQGIMSSSVSKTKHFSERQGKLPHIPVVQE